MKIEFVQDMIDKMRGKKSVKIYPPIYNKHNPLGNHFPDIYNSEGRKMDMFFLRDRHIELPYVLESKYFLWDRYNYGLDIHFYTGNAMLETCGTPLQKYSYLLEPRTKQPKDYKRLEKNGELSSEFQRILTSDEALLNKLPNSLFFPGCSAAWVEPQSETIWQKKTKNISMLSSYKANCPLHHLRLDVVWKLKKQGLADTYGNFDGGPYIKMINILKDYRYTVAFENEISPYFFTERLTSAFLTMTVPIYLGASKVDHFFNPDGIIQITPEQAEHIEDVLKQCSEKDYESRLEAMKENYQRALHYLNLDDLLYEMLFIKQDPNDIGLFRNKL